MRFIIIMILTYMAYKFLTGLFRTKGTQQRPVPGRPGPMGSGEDLVEDPYCHTYIPLSSALKVFLQGQEVYFCSPKCRDEYKASKENRS